MAVVLLLADCVTAIVLLGSLGVPVKVGEANGALVFNCDWILLVAPSMKLSSDVVGAIPSSTFNSLVDAEIPSSTFSSVEVEVSTTFPFTFGLESVLLVKVAVAAFLVASLVLSTFSSPTLEALMPVAIFASVIFPFPITGAVAVPDKSPANRIIPFVVVVASFAAPIVTA